MRDHRAEASLIHGPATELLRSERVKALPARPQPKLILLPALTIAVRVNRTEAILVLTGVTNAQTIESSH